MSSQHCNITLAQAPPAPPGRPPRQSLQAPTRYLAYFNGSTDYTSTTASTTFTITPAAPTLTVSDTGGIYTGTSTYPATFTLAGVGTQSTPGSKLEDVTPTLTYYSGTGTALSGAPSTAGTYSVVASFAGSMDYAYASIGTTFTISRITPTVTVTDAGGGYSSGSSFPATAMVAGGAYLEGVAPTLSYYAGTSVVTASPLSAAPSTVGTYTVLASFAGSTDYLPNTASTTFIITKPVPSVSVTDTSGNYNGSPFNATAMVAGGVSLEGVAPTLTYYSGTSATGSALSGAPSAFGTYAVLASFAGSTDFSYATAQTTFSITKGAPSMAITLPLNTVYNTSAFVATDTVNGVASLEGVTPTLTYFKGATSLGSAPPSAAGTYSATATFAGSTDYNSTSTSTTFTIAKAAPTLTLNDAGGTANGTASFPATDTVAGVGSQSTAGPSLESVTPSLAYYTGTSASGTSSTSVAPKAAGTYTVLATFYGSTDYSVVSKALTFTVIPDPFITATSGSGQTGVDYGQFAQALTVNVVNTAGKPVSGAAVTFTAPTSGASGTFAGGLTSVVVATNSAGTATAPAFTANGVAGSYSVIASTPGAAVSATFTLTNQHVVSAADPSNPGQTALFIGGAAGNDQIHVQPSTQSAGALEVIITDPTVNVDQTVATPTAGFSRLVIYGGPDQNSISIDSSITTAASIYAGGSVSNIVQAGSGPTVVVGGSGANTITGGSGRDILIAGSGKSTIEAGSGDALIIGGTTAYDTNDLALQALLNEWSSAESLSQRVANLGNGSITAGALAVVLNSSTVQSNEKGNTLQGSSPINNDVFFANLASEPDTIIDPDVTDQIF